MIGVVAFLAFVCWLLWLYYRDEKERSSISRAVWLCIVWGAIYGSRSVTEWLSGPGGNLDAMGSPDEGNIVDALISFGLIFAGLAVLVRRGVRWPAVIGSNSILLLFYAFWLLSIFWSDYPLITGKRLFKDFGNVVMALVVLTETNPAEAIKTVGARIAYLCIPLSVLLIRYYPDWGRAYVGYDRSEVMWVGVATHKNTLGVLAMLSAVFLLWDLLDRRGKWFEPTTKALMASRVFVLLLSWHLLVIANSVTSLICAVLGSLLVVTFTFPFAKGRPGRVELFGLASAMVLAMSDWALSLNIKGTFLDNVGRDESLTTRTDVWPLLTSLQDNPLLGAGFNSFWAGERLKLSQEKFGGIIQAHNGYLETYLNGGIIGVGLLMVLLLWGYWRIRQQMLQGTSEGGVRFALLLIAIIHNYSEASFNKVGLLWLVTVFSLMQYAIRLPERSPTAVTGGSNTVWGTTR